MDKDNKLLWEAFDFDKQLNALRASLDKGRKGVILTDLFRDDPERATEPVPVRVSYMMLQTPVVKKLANGETVPNFVGHWSLEPGEGVTRTAVGKSIQHAMMYDSPVSSAADKLGDDTNVSGTMQTIITNVEKDDSVIDDLDRKKQHADSVTRDMKRWRHD